MINSITHFIYRFWKRLGSQISKICPDESKIHIVCKNVNEGQQGKEVRCSYMFIDIFKCT